MLQQLTDQLIKRGELHIPHIGRFQVTHYAAVLQFADRLLQPPYTEVTFSAGDAGTDDVSDAELSKEGVNDFGLQLKSFLGSSPLLWSGIGTLKMEDEMVIFVPEKKHPLLPVDANKVLRENRQHAILVGDQEQSSSDTSFIHDNSEKTKSWFWIGWIILLAALLVIGWILFRDGVSFGTKIKAGTALQYGTTGNIIRV